MGLHKASPSAIINGMTRKSTNALSKDATPRSILSGCSAPATYLLMTAKQCECWTPAGDLLVTEAEQLMEAHALADLDAVYKHIEAHHLSTDTGGGSVLPAHRPSSSAPRERRPSRDFVQEVGVMVRRARARSSRPRSPPPIGHLAEVASFTRRTRGHARAL